MQAIGKISLWLSICALLLGLILAFMLPFFQIFLLPEAAIIYGALILEGIALLLGLVSFKTRDGKLGALFSFLIIVVTMLYFWTSVKTNNSGNGSFILF